jgi:hypothetical protein
VRLLALTTTVLACASTTLGCASAIATGPASALANPATATTDARGLPKSSASSHTVQPQPPANSCHARGHGDFSLPDRHCTQGAIDPAVTQGNIHRTICVSGYTRTVRPPASVTAREKRASMAAYGDHGSPHSFEYDHLVSLELGGARNDARNLWPEPGGVPNPKDEQENRLRTRVCAGSTTLATAQRQIATDWVSAYQRVVGPTP